MSAFEPREIDPAEVRVGMLVERRKDECIVRARVEKSVGRWDDRINGMGEPDARGWRTVTRVEVRESDCPAP